MNTPRNAATNRPYSGCNVVLLWMARAAGYRVPRFLTYKQALELGGHVRKGERGTRVSLSTIDDFLACSGANIREGSGEAYYRPSDDFISLPRFEDFKSAAHFYATALRAVLHDRIVTHGNSRVIQSPCDAAMVRTISNVIMPVRV